MSTSMEKVHRLFPANLRTQLVKLRQDLHRHPELAFAEERTSKQLYAALSELNPMELQFVAGTGVIARIPGKNPGAPVVAIRGDIDALPIQENTGLPYTSENDGVMHACGHDVHATWTVGAAHLLANAPAAGDVLVLLQPAEEIGRGAKAILETRALQEVAAIFAAHVDRRFQVGEVVAQSGPLAASSDTFEVILRGRGAHGARPHESPDPIVGAAGLVMALQTIVSRRLNPADAGVVTVGAIHAGQAPNIIPESARLAGTIRAVTPEVRTLLRTQVEKIVKAQADSHGLVAELQMNPGTPPIVNPPEPVAWAQQAVTDVLGESALKPLGFLNMGGEDFACYLERVPGCFLRVGACELGGEVIPAHSPRFYAAEESIFVGAAVLAETARVASQALLGERKK